VAGDLTGYPLFVSQCARCHGLEGRGDGPGADSPTFAQPPRDLVAGRYRFVSTTNLVASDADLARTISLGLVPAGMPAFGELSGEQVTSLVAVLNQLWKDRPVPGETVAVPAAPPTVDVQEGKALYASMCVLCHGESGRGDGPASTTIVDWKGHSVPPRDLTNGDLKAGRSPEQLYLRIKLGVPGLMPPMGAGLPPEQIWSLVRYLETSILPRQLLSR
jgi:mono/diheme cytochrome c family protein